MLSFFGAVLSCIVDYRAVLSGFCHVRRRLVTLGGGCEYIGRTLHGVARYKVVHAGYMVAWCVCGRRAGVRMPLARVCESNASA